MTPVVVVGAGIAGSATARCLRALGVPVVLVADPARPAHSLAAAALIKGSYHDKHPHEWVQLRRTFHLYQAWGVPYTSGGQVTSYRSADPKPDGDTYLLDPAAPLLAPDVAAAAAPHPAGVQLADGRVLAADRVVWATGAYAKPPTGSKITYGHTWIGPVDLLTDPEVVRVHNWAPYRTIVAGAAGGHARLGSSSATTQRGAEEQSGRLLQMAADVGLIREPGLWRRIAGARIRTTERVSWTDDRNCAFTGLHRTGYALAPAIADDLAHLIVGSLARA